jgi:predicted adenylyl cyclase CyaB
MKNKKVLEVEKKFICKNVEWLIFQALENWFKLVHNKIIENDIYFSDADFLFIEKRICLRIRENNNNCELTYKWASLSQDAFYSKVENNISFDKKSLNNMRELLQNLWYVEYVVVNKTRSIYSKIKDSNEYNIVLDFLEWIWYFVEFEIVSNFEKGLDLKSDLENFIFEYKSFWLEEVNSPYRDIVKEKKI